MDVKNILGPIIPSQIHNQRVSSADKSIKAGSTTDRDANGQMAHDHKKEDPKPPMTEEQLEKAVEHIKNLPGIKEHHLKVELVDQNGKRFIILCEPDGKMIRKIPEIELWSLPVIDSLSPDKKGQILRKSA